MSDIGNFLKLNSNVSTPPVPLHSLLFSQVELQNELRNKSRRTFTSQKY